MLIPCLLKVTLVGFMFYYIRWSVIVEYKSDSKCIQQMGILVVPVTRELYIGHLKHG